jgi:hypothetical protein
LAQTSASTVAARRREALPGSRAVRKEYDSFCKPISGQLSAVGETKEAEGWNGPMDDGGDFGNSMLPKTAW